MEKVYYQDDYSTLSINEILPCLVQTFQGLAHSSEHYRKVQDFGLKLVEREMQHLTTLNVLVDSSQAGSISMDDIEYHRNKVLPMLYEKGVRFIAYIPPEKKISKIIFDEIFYKVDLEELVIKQFNSSSEAKSWLASTIN